MTRLVIARHGNTFEADETPCRVGLKTDIPLVESGREQAKKIGQYLKQHDLVPEITYSSQLKRTIETAEIAIKEAGFTQPVFPLEIFNEIDYGPDENKEESDVIARIGEQAIQDWNEKATVPDGWDVNPDAITRNWRGFCDHIVRDEQDCILVVTSNGIARFAPYILESFDDFTASHTLKIATGALCVFEHDGKAWHAKDWNVRP